MDNKPVSLLKGTRVDLFDKICPKTTSFCTGSCSNSFDNKSRILTIVNIGDTGADEAWPAYVPYVASKAALVSLTRGLARAWAPKIRVNAVAPGPVLLPESESGPEAEREAADRTVLGRVGSPEDVAEAVLYLDNAPYVTGIVLRVDGGHHLK